MIAMWWKIVAFFKRLFISSNRSMLNSIHAKLEKNNGKISIIDRTLNTTKKEFEANKKPFLEYIEFCKSKGIAINAKDQNTLALIDKTEEILDPKAFLDKELKKASEEYDEMYSYVNEAGEKLLGSREECLLTIDSVEQLVNSIAAHPKEFDKQLKGITIQRKKFKDTLDFGKDQKKALENSVKGSGAGLAAGAAVASMAPSAALWVATTFGTASTGTAISALSGAAASNAALAWLGGGALAAGGSGMAAGQALLALAGPVGWGLAGTSIIASALLFWRKKLKIQENKKKEVERMKNCTERLKELHTKIEAITSQTKDLNDHLCNSLHICASLKNGNYKQFSEEDRLRLGTLVNNTNSLSALLNTTVSES